MTPKLQLIDALHDLCEREGGHVVVADAIGANEQTLWQILRGIKLPSGQPRGVGPQLQRKLESKYPGWANHRPGRAEEPRALYAVTTAHDAVQTIARLLVGQSQERRHEAIKVFALLAEYPDEPDYATRMVKLLVESNKPQPIAHRRRLGIAVHPERK